MTDTTMLHDQAMEHADAGDSARRRGDHEAARAHFSHALKLERDAAIAETTQPSRSILFRSAAWLALEAEDARLAERLASSGLSDCDVPERIQLELRAVSEEARMRILRQMAPPSAMSSLAVHLEGPEIGHGNADPVEILSRANALLVLMLRSKERLANVPFRNRGPVPQAVRAQLQPRLEFAAASVVVRVQIGGAQQDLWDASVQLVENVRRCFAALAADDRSALDALIPDAKYRANFEALVSRLAPDGKRVSSVDLLGASTGKSLAPVRIRPRATLTRGLSTSNSQVLTFVGVIRAVDETGQHNTIKLIVDNGAPMTFEVNEAVMEDIVRPYYGQRVTVQGYQKGTKNRWVLTGGPEIAEVDPPAGAER